MAACIAGLIWFSIEQSKPNFNICPLCNQEVRQ